MSFNAVERVVEFLEMDQEAPSITNIRPPSEVLTILVYSFYLYICKYSGLVKDLFK